MLLSCCMAQQVLQVGVARRNNWPGAQKTIASQSPSVVIWFPHPEGILVGDIEEILRKMLV
jgi:hypothetical protein